MILTIDIGGTLIKTLEWPSEKTFFAINFDEINFEAESSHFIRFRNQITLLKRIRFIKLVYFGWT